LKFKFSINNEYTFSPGTRIPLEKEFAKAQLDPEILNNLVFHIGMVEMISYWKAACSPLIMIKPAILTKRQETWWKKLFFKGLGEFFYLNSIEVAAEELVAFDYSGRHENKMFSADLENSAVIPVGGGKDSAVTLNLLKRDFKNNVPFMLNPIKASLETAGLAGYNERDSIVMYRTIDLMLLELNHRGFLNGHTPFSALIAFLGLLAAYVSGKRNIILSNESSSNESTIPGTFINHQYSKTFEFEKDFRNYVSSYISGSFNYFSFLRPLNELQISGLFARQADYLPVFRSCNVGSKQNTWCGSCPKCLFTYIMLSPFLEQDQLITVFRKNLLNDVKLLPVLDQLSGIADEKPFECVGTIDEVNCALDRTISLFTGDSLPPLLDHYRHSTHDTGYGGDCMNKLLNEFNDDNFLDDHFVRILKDSLDEIIAG